MTPRDAVATAYRRLFELGMITGTAGNVEPRTERGMVITPSSVPPSEVTATCICEMGLGTGLLDGDRPSSEWLLHTEVYERSPAGAVVHTHSIAATAVSLLVDELPAVHYYIARLGGPVPVVPYATYGSEELARAVSEALVDRHAAILQNHGAVTTGADIDEAMRRAELLEWLCDLYLRAAAVGQPHTLGAEDLDAVGRQPARITERGYRRA